MKRIKANQIADGYLSEGIDESINPEYFIADEAQAEIDELLEYTGCERQGDCLVSSFISRVCAKGTKGCIAKHKGE